MKLKNKILVLVLGLLMLIATMASALAVPMTFPVWGRVLISDKAMPFEEVELTVCDWGSDFDNCNPMREWDPVSRSYAGKELIFHKETDSTGAFVFELGNLYPSWREGNLLKIQACTGHEACDRIVRIEGSVIELDFNMLGTEIQVIEKVIEKGVEVGDKSTAVVPAGLTDEELEQIDVKIAGEDVSLKDLKQTDGLRWWHGFLGMVIFFVGIFSPRGYKMLNTVIKGLKSGKYKKR